MNALRSTLVTAAVALALAGCAREETVREDFADDSAPVRREATEPRRTAPARAPAPRDVSATPAPAADTVETDEIAPGEVEITGVEACDRYLSNYRACHRMLGVYRPDMIEKRYQELRNALLARSRDPASQGTVAASCEGLARDLDEAVGDRECSGSADGVAAGSDD